MKNRSHRCHAAKELRMLPWADREGILLLDTHETGIGLIQCGGQGALLLLGTMRRQLSEWQVLVLKS